VYRFESTLDFSQSEVFQYHASAGALDRLIPPWEGIRLLSRADSIDVGSEILMENRIFGIPSRWLARHTQLDVPNSFQDIQVSGPFRHWQHTHLFQPIHDRRTQLIDSIDFRLRFEPISKVLMGWVRSKLDRMFAYRHATTRHDLELSHHLNSYLGGYRPKIAITGSNGLVGRRLIGLASVLGFPIVRIVRPDSIDQSHAFPKTCERVVWDPKRGFLQPSVMQGVEGVIHLAGMGIADKRWSPQVKEQIASSRIQSTRDLVTSLAGLDEPPKALVSASAIGIYGDRSDMACSESADRGTGFLADVAHQWEQAALEYASTGRVAMARLSMVLHPRFGALAKMLPVFRMGFGGRVGSGQQVWSWIHIDDAAGALLHLIANPESQGAYNLSAPEAVTNSEFTRHLGSCLSRPTWLPTPAFGLRLLLGEMADSLLLSSCRAVPEKLLRESFPFRAGKLREALSLSTGAEGIAFNSQPEVHS
jgi:uncharacterized protein